MKKVPALIVLLVISALSTLSALDIYVNNVLWHSYSDEALDALITEIPTDSSPPSLPFSLLLPLMEEAMGMHLLFRGGDARLDGSGDKMREARLVRKDGIWELRWDGSRYSRPGRVDLYGRRLDDRELLVWAEPGLEHMEDQIRIWSSLHKLTLRYREIDGMRDELLHCRLTGAEQPDFILSFQPAPAPFSQAKTVAYCLSSALYPDTAETEAERLVLPQGERFHADIFLGLLSGSDAQALPSSFTLGRTQLNRARDRYLDLILTQRIVEKDGASRMGGNLYYPARSFEEIPGTRGLLPDLAGGILPPRILPLQLEGVSDFPVLPLLDFLKLPGIQSSILSLSARQLPSDARVLEGYDNDPGVKELYQEWKSGYILSENNIAFFSSLIEMFPDLYRYNGVLP
jgi:hypothetical protein